jgi:hypothetical protein
VLTWRGAEVVGVFVVVAGAAVTVVEVVKGMLVKTVGPVLVAVSSEGTVITSVTAAEVPRVTGIKTVASVVGGSNVDVIV